MKTMKTINSSESNRLPVLAAEIRAAHEGLKDAATTAAERAIAAGHALLEAKELLKHGEWLPWLKQQCHLSERTAQLYMQIARLGVKPAIVAAIGLQGAAKSLGTWHDASYHPYAHCDETGKHAWELYKLFLVTEWNGTTESVVQHVEWILQRQFKTPEEWLGEEGAAFRKRWCMSEETEAFKRGWDDYQMQHRELSFADIVKALVQRAADEHTF